MTSKRAAELLAQNLTAIYQYAFSRLYEKERADDLTSEIVCEILASAENLQREEAFWGYAWKIAENTFRRFIRRAELSKRVVEFTEECGVYETTPEQEYIEKETESDEVYRLRRELSLLSKTHREVCVAHYVDQKSCSEIAAEKNISVEMVKYYLFKARKQLKEGIGMTRILGEKSYNPGVFRLDFWGDINKYGDLCRRKLPGSIALAAYEKPVSVEELSIELGVSRPYLEEEIEILEAAGILKRNGEKYRTNLVIITEEYEKKFVQETSAVYADVAREVFDETLALMPQIRRLNFVGNDYDDNRLMFALLNMAMVGGYGLAREKSPIGQAERLPLGGHGWIYGLDNDYANYHFHGVTMESWNRDGTAWFSAVNYRVIRDCQLFDHYDFGNKIEAMCDAILQKDTDRGNPVLPWLVEQGFLFCREGKVLPNFPVFDAPVFQEVRQILSPVAERVADCMIAISDRAEKILVQKVPKPVRGQCSAIAKIHHRVDVTAFLMEWLIREKKLTVPAEKMPLCVWGVRSIE